MAGLGYASVMATDRADFERKGSWLTMPTGRRGPSRTALVRPPRVTWWQRGGKPHGHLNVAATELLRRKYPGVEMCVRIRRGYGLDEGRFAIEPVPRRVWRDPSAVLLTSYASSHGAGFSAGALVRLRLKGSSELHLDGDLLVGTLPEDEENVIELPSGW